MIINVAHHEGDDTVIERVDAPVDFEGSGAQEGVLVSFPLEGQDVTGRIIRVLAPSDEMPDAGPIIEVELVDREALDAESEIALAHLPPKSDFTTEL